MKLVVGLGNPGEKYKNTRHNAGFLVVDKLVEGDEWKESKSSGAMYSWIKIGEEKIELFKPQGFMNKSGVAVKAVFKKHPKKFEVTNLENLWVVHDDLDIKLGEYKMSFGKGPREHNGLKSIYEQIGTKDFWHVRVGIDGRTSMREGSKFSGSSTNSSPQRFGLKAVASRTNLNKGEEYVLSSWKPDEKEVILKVIDKIVGELKNVLA